MLTQAFRGGHFEEPNVLAHVRFNDRTDADGKRVLFLEELQSDWHQKGRKHGYADVSDKAAARRAEIEKRSSELGDEHSKLLDKQSTRYLRSDELARVKAIEDEDDALQRELQRLKEGRSRRTVEERLARTSASPDAAVCSGKRLRQGGVDNRRAAGGTV